MDFKQFLDFKTRYQYLDLPDQNYKPAPIARFLILVNEGFLMYSGFGLSWWLILFSVAYLNIWVTVFLISSFILTISVIFWMAVTNQIPILSFIIILFFAAITSLIWIVRVNV